MSYIHAGDTTTRQGAVFASTLPDMPESRRMHTLGHRCRRAIAGGRHASRCVQITSSTGIVTNTGEQNPTGRTRGTSDGVRRRYGGPTSSVTATMASSRHWHLRAVGPARAGRPAGRVGACATAVSRGAAIVTTR